MLILNTGINVQADVIDERVREFLSVWYTASCHRQQPMYQSDNKKLSCRRVTARCFVTLSISLTHSRSLKVIETGTIRKLGYGFLLAFYSNYGSVLLYYFWDKAIYRSKIVIFHTPCIRRPRQGGPRRICGIPFGKEKL